jgi:hypothetical protein
MKKIISVLLSWCMICSLIIPVSAKETSIIETAITWAIETAEDDTHGYSQSNRWGPDYDCSSFIISALKSAGLDTGTASYTGNMRSQLIQHGFQWISWDQVGSVDNLQRGDILLQEGSHTELYLGNNQMVGAHSDRGNPQSGDQTGTEVSVTTYSARAWDGVLRYIDTNLEDEEVQSYKLNTQIFEAGTEKAASEFRVDQSYDFWYELTDGITGMKVSETGISHYAVEMNILDPDGTSVLSERFENQDNTYVNFTPNKIGTYKLVVTTLGEINLTKEEEFTVAEKEIIYAPKTVSVSDVTYTGKSQKPAVTVKDSRGKVISSENYTLRYSNNKNVGKATVKITFKGKYSGTMVKTFSINPKKTSISKVSASKRAFRIKWKVLKTQTTGYQIQYSLNHKFTDAKMVTINKNKIISKTIVKLRAKKKYYVRIRAYKTVSGKKYYSNWSGSKTVTTKK